MWEYDCSYQSCSITQKWVVKKGVEVRKNNNQVDMTANPLIIDEIAENEKAVDDTDIITPISTPVAAQEK